TENDTNLERLFGAVNPTPYVKDGINDAIVHGLLGRANRVSGSKAAAHCRAMVHPGHAFTVQVRFSPVANSNPFVDFDTVMSARQREADDFYQSIQAPHLSDDERLVQRQAFAGLLWSKQFYHYDVHDWLRGDPAQPLPPSERWHGRNRDW